MRRWTTTTKGCDVARVITTTSGDVAKTTARRIPESGRLVICHQGRG
jgi:hypothetical protein